MKLKSPSLAVVEEAIDLLSDKDLEREQIIEALGCNASEEYLSVRLTDWIPECFGMTVVAHIEGAKISSYFHVQNERGTWRSVPMRVEPILAIIFPISNELFHAKKNEVHKQVASRSSYMDSLSKNHAHGSDSVGAQFTGPFMHSIPASVYRSSLPWWIRMHWK